MLAQTRRSTDLFTPPARDLRKADVMIRYPPADRVRSPRRVVSGDPVPGPSASAWLILRQKSRERSAAPLGDAVEPVSQPSRLGLVLDRKPAFNQPGDARRHLTPGQGEKELPWSLREISATMSAI